MPVLAVERTLRAVLLVGVGLILLTHAHTDWTDLAPSFTEQVGLDPSRNETGRLILDLVQSELARLIQENTGGINSRFF